MKMFKQKPPISKHEMKVLEYLALHKDSLIYTIKKGTFEHYTSIYRAITKLKDKGFIEYGKLKKSEKSYKLTFEGICFLFTYSQNLEAIKKVLWRYEEDFKGTPEYQHLLDIEKKVNPNVLLKIKRITGRSALGGSAFNPEGQLATAMGELCKRNFTSSELRELKRVSRDIPKVNAGLRQIAHSLNSYLEMGVR